MTIISAGLSRYSNNPTTDLAGAINNSVTSIVVDSNLGFPYPGPFRILIDNEQMQVTGGSNTTTWTVIRAVDGTAAASHSDEAAVTNNITAFDYNQFRAEFNPLAYLAAGDGVADDFVPFQNAINDAHALTNGGHIFLPDLPFKINSNLIGYANVVFVTYGAVISGTGAASVTPLIRWSQVGGLTLPAALVVASGGATIAGNVGITGNLSATGTTSFNAVAYTWPGTSGSATQVLTSNGAGTLSWAASGGAVSSVSGTANQISVSPTTGATIVGLPAGGTLPGTWSAETGFTILSGGLNINAGALIISAGGAVISGGITGTLATGAQPNVTSLGTLSALGVTGAITSLGSTVGAGTIGYAQRSTAQTGIGGSQTDITGVTTTVNIGSGRRIRISARMVFNQSVGAAFAFIYIKEGASTLASHEVSAGATGGGFEIEDGVILTPTVGAHTYKVAMSVNSGTISVIGGASCYILVEDIGV